MAAQAGWPAQRKHSAPAPRNAAGSESRDVERPIWNIYTKAVSSYIPARYDGKVFLFREIDLPPELAWLGSDLGWRKIARSLSIHNIPGGHFTITEHSNIMIFAEQLKVCLQEAEAARAR